MKERPYLAATEVHVFAPGAPRDLACAIRHDGEVFAGMRPRAGLVSTVLFRVADGVQTPVVFDAAARSIDAMMRRSTGSLLLAGTRALGQALIPALWEKTASGFALLGTALAPGGTPTSLGETPRGELFMLTEADLHFFDEGAAVVAQRLPIFQLPAGCRGGYTACFHHGQLHYTSRMSTHAGTGEGGPSIDALIFPAGSLPQTATGTAWFGHNNLAVWMGDVWGIARFERTLLAAGVEKKIALQTITWFDKADWFQPAFLVFDESFVKWRRLQELDDLLLAFGKRTGGGHLAGVGSGRTFRQAEFPYEVLRAVKCRNAADTGNVALMIARHAQDDSNAPAHRIIETSGDLVYPTAPPEPESGASGAGTSGTSGASGTSGTMGGSGTSGDAPATDNGSTCGSMDICFVVDTTGSMGTAIGSVRRELELILDDIGTASGDDYRLSLVEFKDYSRVLVPFGPTTPASRAAFKTAIRALEASGGGGEPEASNEAVNHAVSAIQGAIWDGGTQSTCYGTFADWRPGALKIVIVITDARPAGFDDAYADGVDDVRAHDIALAAAAAGIKIAALYTPTTSDGARDATITRIMRDYASTTNSIFARTRFGGAGTGAIISRVIAGCGVVPLPPAAPPTPPRKPPSPRADDPDEGAYLDSPPGAMPPVCVVRLEAGAAPISAIQAFDASQARVLEIFAREYSCVWCRIDSTAPDDDLSSFTERVPYSKWHGLSVAAREFVDVLFYLPPGTSTEDLMPTIWKWN